ncbi:Uncharacterised protein [Shigella sonnei]|nr:Uncharacterised protein [Shigella sonnei]CSP58598.1 Uncharacterised protein [Shigella sonnei]CSP84195.1 Uncharacterised protein [Shigella sonnei]CSS81074.1 Uncharacterised protein [Shigella sonnei]
MLTAKFFRRPGSVTTNGLPHRRIIRDTFTKRAGTDNFLLCRCKFFQLQTGFTAQFTHRSFEHDIKMFTDKPDICIRQIKNGFDPHRVQFFADPPSNPPDVIHGESRH